MLSRVPDLRVVSRAASTGRRQDDPWRTVSELGARYVLTGNVRRAGERVRVFVELSSATDRSQLWSATYDRRLADLFELQDDIAEAIVVSFGGELLRAEWQRASTRATESLDGLGLVQKAKSMNLPVSGRAAIDEALSARDQRNRERPTLCRRPCLPSLHLDAADDQPPRGRLGAGPKAGIGCHRTRCRAFAKRSDRAADARQRHELLRPASKGGRRFSARRGDRTLRFHSWGRLGRTLAYGGGASELEKARRSSIGSSPMRPITQWSRTGFPSKPMPIAASINMKKLPASPAEALMPSRAMPGHG